MVSAEEEKENLYRIGKHMQEFMKKTIQEKKGGQCQVLGPLVRTMAIGQTGESAISPTVMAHLLGSNTKTVANLIERGKGEKLDVIVDHSRESKKRGDYHTPEEEKCTIKYVASFGDLCPSTKKRYVIKSTKRAIYAAYLKEGVISIVLTMWIQFRDFFRSRVDRFLKKSDEEKKKVGEASLTRALYAIYLWEQNKFQGECPPFKWHRKRKKFWQIVNAKKEGSRQKILKTFFGFKLKMCKFCTEFDEEIEIYKELQKSYAEEKNPKLANEKKIRLDQWSKKILALRRHKDKHEAQRKAVQKWKEDCKDHPGECLVYEDFCNLYEANNAKMLNLVMVLVYWDKKAKDGKGDVIEEYYDTFCRGSMTLDEMGNLQQRGSQDNYVYKECWREAFRQKIFKNKGFHTIIKTGDNGSALKSYETLHLHSVLMEEEFIRIIYHTLCPHHAENVCDPAGAVTKKDIKEVEKYLGSQTGDAKQTAEARNLSRKSPKIKEAMYCEAPREFDKYIPKEMIREKQNYWPYSLGECCVFFLQLTDIHENAEHPLCTIEHGACGYGAPTANDPFGVIDLRWDTLNVKKICMDCSIRFGRTVLEKEHNQKGFFLCPTTHVYRRETKESLDRICGHCNKSVREAHSESLHTSDECPSKAVEGKQLYEHKSFRVITIDGPKRFTIFTGPVKKWTSDDVTPQLLDDIKSRYQKRKSPEQRLVDPKTGSVAEARMMAPGICVAYLINSAGRSGENGNKLSWGFGECIKVNKDKKNFEIEVFVPLNKDPLRAPWGQWKTTTLKKEISFSDSSWMKVGKLSRGKIPTRELYKIWKDQRFGWQWISTYWDPDHESSEPIELEFVSLDEDSDRMKKIIRKGKKKS